MAAGERLREGRYGGTGGPRPDTPAEAGEPPMATYSFRFFDHTADVGVEAEAGSAEELFAAVTEAVVHLLLARPPRAGDPGRLEERAFVATGPDLETLLVRWVNEILHWVQVEGWVPARAAVTLRPLAGGDTTEGSARDWDPPGGAAKGDRDEGWSLTATCTGLPLDARAMGFRGEIKAATYHQLVVRRVAPAPGGWQARIILDV